MMVTRLAAAAAVMAILAGPAPAQTREDWIALGTQVHGGFGAFIPLGIKIGLDARDKLKLQPREAAVTYYDGAEAPCACFADGIAIATTASVGQRSLTVAAEKAPPGMAAVAVIRPRKGGPGLRYAIPMASLKRLGEMNATLDPPGRWDAVMKADGLFTVEPVP